MKGEYMNTDNVKVVNEDPKDIWGDEPEHGELDLGDFRWCRDCEAWTEPTKRTETTGEHKILTIYTCPCGAESEEV